MRHALLALLLAVTAAGCGRGDRKVCEQACRNYYTLAFWNKWDPQINAEPEAERAKLRQYKLSELEAGLAQGVDQCVESCTRANNDDQYKCMAEAKDWAKAHACAETEEE